MNTAISAMLVLHGDILSNGETAGHVLGGTIASVCGIQTLQMGVFGGIIVGLGVAVLHNRFYKISLPNALSFLAGQDLYLLSQHWFTCLWELHYTIYGR